MASSGRARPRIGEASSELGLVLSSVRAAIHSGGTEEGKVVQDGDGINLDVVVELAVRQGVASLTYTGLKKLQVQVPSSVWDQLRLATLFTYAGNRLQMETACRRALDVLARAEIEVIVLKGPALAHGAYENPAFRTYGDIDLMVRRKDLEVASDTLRLNGCVVDGAAGELLPAGHHHLPAHQFVATGVSVELHHHLIADPNPYHIDADDLWARAVRRPIGMTKALVLSREDALHHACIHLSYSHLYEQAPLRGLVDILAIVTRGKEHLDWNLFASLVEEARTAGAVYWPLHQARVWLGAPIPEQIIDRLAPIRPLHRTLEVAIDAPLLIESSRAPDRSTQVLYTVLREFSLYTGCNAWTQIVALSRSLFPSRDRVGHLPATVRRHRVSYCLYLADPHRLGRGLLAAGRMLARLS